MKLEQRHVDITCGSQPHYRTTVKGCLQKHFLSQFNSRKDTVPDLGDAVRWASELPCNTSQALCLGILNFLYGLQCYVWSNTALPRSLLQTAVVQCAYTSTIAGLAAHLHDKSLRCMGKALSYCSGRHKLRLVGRDSLYILG